MYKARLSSSVIKMAVAYGTAQYKLHIYTSVLIKSLEKFCKILAGKMRAMSAHM